MAKKKSATSELPERQPATKGYTVVARRYRPQLFGELVGQEAVAQALMNAIKGNRVAHAYLFTGARGVGKTSAARILAKALNCVNGPTPNPCGICENCQGIASGEDVDVIEIDGASNRGIENVREIRSNVQYRPSRARYKIYIIDEVHMLSKDAFNALLKTLEEPPDHVKFIFATTEVQKIPITVLSRCQRFDFGTIGATRIVDRLRDIVANEGLKADDEALEMVARRAAGSMRDAQSLLDQLLAFGGDHLTVDQVHQLLGTAGDDRVLELAGAVLSHDAKLALDCLGKAADEGQALGELLDQLIGYWRDLLVIHCAGQEALDLSIPARHRETASRQANSLKLDTLLAGLDVLNSTKMRMFRSNHGRVLFEMALVRLGRMDDLIALSQISQLLSSGPGQGMSPPNGPRPTLARSPEIAETVKKKPLTSPEACPVPAEVALSGETLPQIWSEVLTRMGPMMAAKLQNLPLPAISGPNSLELRVPSGYTLFHNGRQPNDRSERIEEELRRITGHACRLKVELAPERPEDEATASSLGPASTPVARRADRRSEALQDPLLRYAVEVLEAQVLQVDEGFGTARAVPEDTKPSVEAETED